MHKVIIIGGGVAGLSCVSILTSQSSVTLDITLIEKKNFVEAGLYSLRLMAHPHEFNECHVMLDDLRKRYERRGHSVRFFTHSQAVSIDPSARTITVQSGVEKKETILQYNYLVLANGSIYSTPYVKPDPNTLADPQSRLQELQSFRQQIDVEENKHVMICGGGLLGIELCGELIEINKTRKDPFKITLVHSRMMLRHRSNSASIHNYIFQFLKSNHVDVVLGHRVVTTGYDFSNDFDPSVAKKFTLIASDTDDKSEARFVEDVNIAFWCGSLKPATAWLANSSVELDDTGCVKVNSFMQSLQHTDIFAIGDVNNAPCEKLSGSARVQAKVAAQNIVALANGKTLSSEYKGKKIPAVSVSLGTNDAYFSIGSKIVFWGGWAASLKSNSSKYNMLKRLQNA